MVTLVVAAHHTESKMLVGGEAGTARHTQPNPQKRLSATLCVFTLVFIYVPRAPCFLDPGLITSHSACTEHLALELAASQAAGSASHTAPTGGRPLAARASAMLA